jgi:hypothetical protein
MLAIAEGTSAGGLRRRPELPGPKRQPACDALAALQQCRARTAQGQFKHSPLPLLWSPNN